MTRTKLLTYSGNSTCIGRSVQHTVLTGTGSLYCALKKKLCRFLFYLCECACVFLFLPLFFFFVSGRLILIVAEHVQSR